MFRWIGLLAVLLLSLASGVVPVPKLEDSDRVVSVRDEQDFHDYAYSLGAYSSALVEALSGDDLSIEGHSHDWNCQLIFANPSEGYVEWIHQVELSCERDAETLIYPLGEGEFRRAYTSGRVLIKGVAAESLAEILAKNADDKSVESPISERLIAWGPNKTLKILTLRRSDRAGKLQFSLECYVDADANSLHSCAMLF